MVERHLGAGEEYQRARRRFGERRLLAGSSSAREKAAASSAGRGLVVCTSTKSLPHRELMTWYLKPVTIKSYNLSMEDSDSRMIEEWAILSNICRVADVEYNSWNDCFSEELVEEWNK